MSKKVNRWLRSKTGVRVLAGLLVLVLIVAALGAVLGWWAALGRALRGTALPPGGYSCFPSCVEDDGMFLSMPSEGLKSFDAAPASFWITVPDGETGWSLDIFDGDSGKDDNGSLVGYRGGNWDGTTAATTYALYADPMKDGTGTVLIGQWSGADMPNNQWFEIPLNTSLEAKSQRGDYIYRLYLTQPAQPVGINRIKLRSTGYISTGRADLLGASFAIVGGPQTENGITILFPDYNGDRNNPGPSKYKGDWQFYLYVPENATELEIWDGDFDRGTTAVLPAGDGDDSNTTGKPEWAATSALPESAKGKGAPSDDFSAPVLRVDPPVRYDVIDPAGQPILQNDEPSGTQEWEKFLISTDSSVAADKYTDVIEPGFYLIHIQGLDGGNTVWIRANYEIMTTPNGDECLGTCPRTIGYWKNNVKKVLIQNKTNGTQETADSIHHALYLVAQYSPLFRQGINVQDPQPIEARVPLSDQEVDMILQRDHKTYPGGKDSANSMLARALQQDLAAWLNWGSGKICNDTYVTLPNGVFEGLIWDALQTAQTIVFNSQTNNDAELGRAKDIGDLINNGLLGEDADIIECADTTTTIPPDKQPKDPHDTPKSPKQPEPPAPVPQPIPCDAPRVNTYGVENPTNNPFPGIKFEYQSGTEVRDGNLDEFRIVVPAATAAGLTSVQVEAKAGQDQAVATVTLEGCDFTSPVPCGEPITDDNNFFAFYYMGAEDNGDGNLTLVFHVQNFTAHGLSHATFGVPDTIGPSGSYQSSVCP